MKAAYSGAYRYFNRLLRSRGRAGSRSEKIAADLKRIARWGWEDNIVGIAFDAGTDAEKPTVQVLVKRKMALEKLTKTQRIPKRIAFRSLDLEMDLGVDELCEEPLLHAPVARPGLDIAHEVGTSGGTLGFIVSRGGTKLLLSCAHVLTAVLGKAGKGDVIEAPFDPLTKGPAIARLESFTVFTKAKDNLGDFALARLDDEPDPRLLTTGARVSGPVGWDSADAPVGLDIVQHGCKNGPSEGAITKRQVTVRFGSAPGGGSVTLAGLVEHNAACGPGDSGGPIVVKKTLEAAGIHVGGVAGGSRGFFYPIRNFLLDNNLKLVT